MKNIFIVILLICVPQLSFAYSEPRETIETEDYTISYPSLIHPWDDIRLKIENKNCVSLQKKHIDFEYLTAHNPSGVNIHLDSKPSPTLGDFCYNFAAHRINVTIGRLRPGRHKISIVDQNGSTSFDLIVEERPRPTLFNAEAPSANSIQSGIGLIRGWACDAQAVLIRIDHGESFIAPYGGTREDTLDICGDTNNGYAFAMNWAELSKGIHHMSISFLGSGTSSEFEFEVLGLDESYITGLSHSHVISNFPTQGESVTVQWDEESQNFIIVEQD